MSNFLGFADCFDALGSATHLLVCNSAQQHPCAPATQKISMLRALPPLRPGQPLPGSSAPNGAWRTKCPVKATRSGARCFSRKEIDRVWYPGAGARSPSRITPPKGYLLMLSHVVTRHLKH